MCNDFAMGPILTSASAAGELVRHSHPSDHALSHCSDLMVRTSRLRDTSLSLVRVPGSSLQHLIAGNLFAVGAAGGAMSFVNSMNYQSFFLKNVKNPS